MFIWIKADNQSGSQLSYFSGGAVAPFTYQTAVSCSEKKVLQNLEKTPGNFVCFFNGKWIDGIFVARCQNGHVFFRLWIKSLLPLQFIFQNSSRKTD